jgi:hypothetical protein
LTLALNSGASRTVTVVVFVVFIVGGAVMAMIADLPIRKTNMLTTAMLGTKIQMPKIFAGVFNVFI